MLIIQIITKIITNYTELNIFPCFPNRQINGQTGHQATSPYSHLRHVDRILAVRSVAA